MSADYYHHKIPGKGFAIIKPSGGDAGFYGLWFNNLLIYDGFDSPEDAALKANKKDFPPDVKTERFPCWVPSDLHSWAEGLPPRENEMDEEQEEQQTRSRPECSRRPWRSGNLGR